MTQNQDIKNRLLYRNLWDQWLDSHDTGMPSGFDKIKRSPTSIKPHFLRAEDASAYMNAEDPYDLYLRPDQSANDSIGYSTNAFYSGSKFSNQPDSITFITGESNKLPFNSVQNSIPMDMPKRLQGRMLQGIYEHEVQHSKDPRLKKDSINYIPDVNPNHGIVNMDGLTTRLMSRENPAIDAEVRYWHGPMATRGIKKERDSAFSGPFGVKK